MSRSPLCKSLLFVTTLWVLAVATWATARCEGTGGRPLVSVWGVDPGDYDPQHTSNPLAQEIFRHVCEPLFYRDFAGSIHGLLAEDEVAYSEGGRRVTVRLREGITFHDGTPLDAAVVQASFERLQRLGLSPLVNDLRDVTVTAQPDGRSVVFTLPQPDYEFVRLVLTSSYAAIVSSRAEDGAEPGFVAGTGPYRFAPVLYHPGCSLTLARNAGYRWSPAHIHRLTFRFEQDRDARLELLLDGDACFLSLSRQHESAVAALPRFRRYTATGGVTYLGFNFQHPRWQDIRARQALALALDKSALAAGGPFWVADTPLAPNAIGYDPRAAAFGYGYDPERSRALLAEVAFDTGAEIVLLIPESNTYRELAAAVQQQLAAVGLTQVCIREALRTEVLALRQDFDLLLFDYAWNDYTILGILLGSGPRNLLNYASDDVAGLVAQARTTADLEQRQQLVLDAQRMVLEQAIWQPLLVRRLTFAVDGACVHGEQQSPAGALLFYNAQTAPW